MLNIKKSTCLKWTCRLFGKNCTVAMLFIWNTDFRFLRGKQTVKDIILESWIIVTFINWRKEIVKELLQVMMFISTF